MTGEDKDFLRVKDRVISPTIITESLGSGSGATNFGSATNSYSNGANISFGTSTGTKIGKAVNEKMGFYGATPAVKQAVDAGANVATLIAVLSGMGLLGDPNASA
jgi:hypothetical protein